MKVQTKVDKLVRQLGIQRHSNAHQWHKAALLPVRTFAKQVILETLIVTVLPLVIVVFYGSKKTSPVLQILPVVVYSTDVLSCKCAGHPLSLLYQAHSSKTDWLCQAKLQSLGKFILKKKFLKLRNL